MPTCKLPGCENKFAFSKKGSHARLFCCDRHRDIFHNAKKKFRAAQKRLAVTVKQNEYIEKYVATIGVNSTPKRQCKIILCKSNTRANELRSCGYFQNCLTVAAFEQTTHIPCAVCTPLRMFWKYPYIIKYDE